jgi:hypothetical protein
MQYESKINSTFSTFFAKFLANSAVQSFAF